MSTQPPASFNARGLGDEPNQFSRMTLLLQFMLPEYLGEHPVGIPQIHASSAWGSAVPPPPPPPAPVN
jgi:hypothetical protein